MILPAITSSPPLLALKRYIIMEFELSLKCLVITRDVIDSRQVDAPLSKNLSIVASIRLLYRCDRIDKIYPQMPLHLGVKFYRVLRLSAESTCKIMSGRPIRSPKQMAAILFYCAHRIRSTFRTTMSETFPKRTAHHVRSIRDTNISNVRVSNEQM